MMTADNSGVDYPILLKFGKMVHYGLKAQIARLAPRQVASSCNASQLLLVSCQCNAIHGTGQI